MNDSSSTTSFSSASEHAAAIRANQTSSESVTRLYAERIRNRNPNIRAIVVDTTDEALRHACERDQEGAQGAWRGQLHGAPVTVKESFNLAGTPTTVNFPPLRKNSATQDALVVHRLREAGAVILGKTNIPTMLSDFQSRGPLYPTASNPWDTSRTPGGSTGGGGAAVAAGLTTLEIGSDIGGSIRQPAHCCGVFGLKPTENALQHGEGHVPPMPDGKGGIVLMACIGPLARSMADIELAWSLINHASWNQPTHLPQRPLAGKPLDKLRVAWFDDAGPAACGKDTRAVLGEFIGKLSAAGVHCEKQPVDERWLKEALNIWATLFGVVAGQDAPWIARRIMRFQISRMMRASAFDMAPSLGQGLALDLKAFAQALGKRIELVQELDRRFADFDFIVSPVMAGPAFHHNPKHEPIALDGGRVPYADYSMPFLMPWNAMGNPALSVPAGRSSEGMPVGLQIIAPHFAELDLIHFGREVERLGVTFTPPPGW